MAHVKQTVFISSTSKDLLAHRALVIKDVNERGYSAINQEGFLPDKDNALQTCYNALQGADIFIGIYAYRYGFCPPVEMEYLKEGVTARGDGETSITEWEYRWAIEKGIKHIYLFVADTDKWDKEKDSDLTKITKFRDEISLKHIVGFFDETPITLAKGVITTLLEKHHPDQAPEKPTLPPYAGKLDQSFRKDKQFFDRDEQRDKLHQYIQNQMRVITLYGRGGIGKTGLVSYVLEELADTIGAVDGLVYRSLQYNTPDNALTIREIVGDFAQIIPSLSIPHDIPHDQQIALLLQALKDKRNVLLLDNFETVQHPETGEILAPVLKSLIDAVLGRGGLTIIITTRHRFPIRDLTLSAYAKWMKLEEGLPLADAKSFMRSMNGSEHLPTDEAELERFIDYVRGIPRGLEVGMGWLNDENGHHQLSDLFDDVIEAERVIEHIVGKVIDDLAPERRQILDAIAIAHEPASIGLLTYLLEPFRTTTKLPLQKAIHNLIDSQFISKDDDNRYTIHALDREHCLKTLAVAGDEADFCQTTLNRRAITYYQSQRKPQADWRTIDDVHPQLMEFEHHFALGDYDEAVEVLKDVDAEYLLGWGHAQEVRDYHLRLEGKIVDLKLQSSSFSRLGVAYDSLGEGRQAIACYEQGLEIARVIGDKRGEGAHLGNLGAAYQHLGEVWKAVDYHEKALAIARVIGDKRGEGVQLGNLGSAYQQLGEVRKAIDYFEKALAIACSIGNKRGEGSTLGSLGTAYGNLGEVRKAIDYFEGALVVARTIGDKWNEGRWLGSLGLAYQHLGEVRKAIDYYEGALVVARAIGDKRNEGSTLGSLGLAYQHLGEVRKAIDYYEGALGIACSIGNKRGEGSTLGSLGNAYADLGEVRKAIDYFEGALAIARMIGNQQGEGVQLGNLGSAYQQLGEVRKAIDYFEGALAIARMIGDKQGEGNTINSLGLAYWHLGEVRKAIDYFEKALAIARVIGDKRGEGNTLGSLGLAYADLGEVRKAIDYHEDALAIARTIGDKGGEGIRLSNLGGAYWHLGEVRKAIEYYEKALAIARAIDDKRNEGSHLGNLGVAYHDLGEVQKAIEYYEKSLGIAHTIGDKEGEGIRLGNLGVAYHDLGELAKTLDYWQQALKIAQEIEHKEAIDTWTRNIQIVKRRLNGGE